MQLDILTGKKPPELHHKVNLIPSAAKSFLKMQAQAKKDGVSITPVSGYRSLKRQTEIWNAKYHKNFTPHQKDLTNIKKILNYSAIPGTSRHHWGSDVDITGKMPTDSGKADYLVTENFMQGGLFAKTYQWLIKNSGNFGFLLVYDNDPNRKGFFFEPWHFSYAPLSKKILKVYLTLDWKKFLSTNVILAGADAFDADFLAYYEKSFLKSINPDLLD